MTIKEVKDKKIWENFLLAQKEKTFCQSWDWGEFNEAMGDRVWRLAAFDGSNIAVVFETIKISARRGKFLFVPHGPVFSAERKNAKEIISAILEHLKTMAMAEGASFIRISPILIKTELNEKIFKEIGFRPAPIHMHPELTWELDITQSEEAILKNMRKTTRYLIRQAE
ncbi:MAG: peptidoglycan bridge formation glycyltransferase FemA/FemB family protein, partial [Candidatus Pacebacteria bacterium]|nr:peptidoglycan bridge formation glycyltransferase FemA/FemB family protein [Candidatus Paceibacterota bacterium]